MRSMPKIWKHRDPSTFIETEGLSGLGDSYSDSLIPSTTTTPSTPEPGLPPGPVVIVQRPPTPTKPTYREDPERVRAQSKWAEMMRTCPWNAEQRGAYDSLMYSGYLNAAQKQQLQGQAGRCIAASSATTRPVTLPVTGPSATIAAALARAQAQAALAAAVAAAGKATTQAISKLKPSGVSAPTAPAGGVSATAKELAAKNQALREQLAKSVVKDVKSRSLEEIQRKGAEVEAEIAAYRQEKGITPPATQTFQEQVNKNLEAKGLQSTNFVEMLVANKINQEFVVRSGLPELRPNEVASMIADQRKSGDISKLKEVAEASLKQVVKDRANSIFDSFYAKGKSTAAKISDEALGGVFKSGSKNEQFIKNDMVNALKKGVDELKGFIGIDKPVPVREADQISYYNNMANKVELVVKAGYVSKDFLIGQINEKAGLANRIESPAKVGLQGVFSDLVGGFQNIVTKPGVAGTASEVLRAQDPVDKLEKGKVLADLLKNYVEPQVDSVVKNQYTDAVNMFVDGTPKEVFEMQRQRADSFKNIDRLQNRIDSLSASWEGGNDMELANLQSQLRQEQKNVNQLAQKIEYLTKNPETSKYASVVNWLKSMSR